MKQKQVTPDSIEALDFIASRLLNFKRVQFEEFCELVSEKYKIAEPAALFYELINKDGAYLWNGMLIAGYEEVLKHYCIAPALLNKPALLAWQTA